MQQELKQAIDVLNQGGIVIFPTDTVWGIGCRLDKPESIKKLYKIRKRPENQAFPVLVSSVEQAKEYYKTLPIEVEELLKKYWPGGLTVVYYAKKAGTIGLRMPNHKDLLYLIYNIGVPVLGPSANFHGEKTPVLFSDLNPELVKLVDFVLPGESLGGQSSTVVDCTQNPWKILRQGMVHLVVLYIDTTDNQKVVVSINNDKNLTLVSKASVLKAQTVLPLIEKLLKVSKLKLKDLTEIKVNTGPGSYTGIRVGLSVANALSYALGIKVNGKDIETEAKY